MELIANKSQSLSSEYSLILTGRSNQILIINNAQWRDVGVYKCIASIDHTMTEAQTSLNVLSKKCIYTWHS